MHPVGVAAMCQVARSSVQVTSAMDGAAERPQGGEEHSGYQAADQASQVYRVHNPHSLQGNRRNIVAASSTAIPANLKLQCATNTNNAPAVARVTCGSVGGHGEA